MPRAHNNISGLYVICDPAFSKGRDILVVASEAIRGGARAIQLRDKGRTLRELYTVALELAGLASEKGALFIVNDSVELAMAAGADGVHLGQDDMPVKAARKAAGAGMIIGISTHSLEEALAAQEEGADYIGYGPMFKTSTKDVGTPKGIEGLKAIRGRVKIPIVAIGGVNADNAAEIVAAGADAVAVISAVAEADDIYMAAAGIAEHFKA
jgi:thiamine-phosphate diphosphorylase